VRTRIIVAVGVAVMLAGAIGFAQGQGRVEKSTGGEQWEGFVFSCDGDSGPFDVWERYEGTWVDSLRYDKNGNPVQLIRTVKFPIDVMWNTTTGKTLKGGPGLRNEIRIGINESGEWVSSESSGPVIKFIIPGYGPVYMETGHTRWNPATWAILSSTGHNDFADLIKNGQLKPEAVEAICDYLGSE